VPDPSNLLLDSLLASDREALMPHLKPMRLAHKDVLFEAGERISAVYFPTGGVVSLIIGLSNGTHIESAMVGRDGVVGASAALDGRISLCTGVVQLEGTGLVCDVAALRELALGSHTFLSKLIRHDQTLFAQAQQSTACMAEHNVEARLARWLLRARDLSGTDTLIFTQEFLAEMLGVQRSSVTLAARMLQQTGIIRYSRGKIWIVDVEALQEAACECYAAIKEHHAILLGQ
jgi:CRP-like cAMP-binding protein